MSSGEDRPSGSTASKACGNFAEEAPVGICVVQETRVVYANRWLREASGSAASVDQAFDEFVPIHPDDRNLFSEQTRLLLAGKDALPSYTVRLVRRDGGLQEVELYPRSIDHCGRPAVQVTLIDISSRIEAERNLQEYASRLEESNRFRQLFGDILSHDLMSPVWVAENYLRLAMDGGVPEAKLSFYEGMCGSLAKARVILTDARTYLRIQDRVAYTGERIEVVPLVEGVLGSLRPLWEEKGQEVRVNLAADAVINASPMVKEIVWHLLSNAIKYGPPGAPIDVAVSVGPLVRIEVRDRGPGVREEDRERVFRRFESMEKGPISGVGLGLAIARRLTELHGGRIWVEENPEGGSVFVVEFPAAEGQSPD